MLCLFPVSAFECRMKRIFWINKLRALFEGDGQHCNYHQEQPLVPIDISAGLLQSELWYVLLSRQYIAPVSNSARKFAARKKKKVENLGKFIIWKSYFHKKSNLGSLISRDD